MAGTITNSFKALCLIVLCFGFFLAVEKADAHFILVDDQIGAILHIDPNDSPVANSPSTFNFSFKDPSNRLDLRKCDCTFSIISNGSPIYTAKLSADPNIQFSATEASFQFTLPETGIYTLIMEGKPMAPVDFQSFKLSYDLRVDQRAETGGAPSALLQFLAGHSLHYILFGGAILISLYIIIRDIRRNKKI